MTFLLGLCVFCALCELAIILVQHREICLLQLKLNDTFELKEAAVSALNKLVESNIAASTTIDKLRKAYNGSEAARKKLYAEVHGE